MVTLKAVFLSVVVTLYGGDRTEFPFAVWLTAEFPGRLTPMLCYIHDDRDNYFAGAYLNVNARGLKACDFAIGYDARNREILIQYLNGRYLETQGVRDVSGWRYPIGQFFPQR